MVPLPSTSTSHHTRTLVFQHSWVPTSLCQTTLLPPPAKQQASSLHNTTEITQPIVPLTFASKQTFGDPIDHHKLPHYICFAFCNVAGFPIDPIQQPQGPGSLCLPDTVLILMSLGAARVTSTGNGCHLDIFMSGSNHTIPSMQSLTTTPMMTLATASMAAPFS